MKEALTLALETLVEMSPSGPIGSEIWHKQMNAIRVAGDALAQPEEQQSCDKQEPVTWGVDWGKAGDSSCVSIIKRLPDGGMEVVAMEYGPQQRPWVGLTDEDKQNLAAAQLGWEELIEAVEAKFKEFNT